MAQFLRVRDERLNTSDINDAKFIVKEGPRTSYVVLPPQSLNTGTLVYQLNNVGPNVGRNRALWVNPIGQVVLNGSFTAVPAAGQLGLKLWPFNRNCITQHQLNGASETYLSYQIVDFLARMKTNATCTQPYDNIQPDNCTDYATVNANISPLCNYTATNLGNGVAHPRNVGITSIVLAGTPVAGVYPQLIVNLNWWECLITPFSAIGDDAKNLPAIYSIDGETITVTFQNALSDVLAYNSIGTVTSSNFYFTNNATGLNGSCNLYVEYITARDLMLPEVSMYQFMKYQRFQSLIGTKAPSSTPAQVTVQVNAQTMPSKFVCFIRCTENDRNATTPDCYANILQLQVQLDNGTTLLNGASQRTLYNISRQNGLTDVFPVFAQYNLAGVQSNIVSPTPYYGAGTVLILDPTKDLSISTEENLSNNSSGKYTVQFTFTYTNAQTITNATAYVYAINDSLLIRQGRNYMTKYLAYSKEEVMNARQNANFIELQEYEEAQQNNLFLSGGSFKSFFKKLWDNRHKIISHAADAYKVGKEIHDTYKGMKGGYSIGGGDMKMYYD